jgi:hypothetical protein
MFVGKQKSFLVLKRIETFQVTVPSFDNFLVFNLCGDLDEIFSLEVLEVLKFLVVYFQIRAVMLHLMMFLL